MDTNGFTSPAAIRQLAPYLDMVHVGVKGHADPDFYAKRMRAPGAVEHELKALKTWNDSPTMLGVSDVVTPHHGWTTTVPPLSR
jgi:pyruvate-formate lyase-activating enzyme